MRREKSKACAACDPREMRHFGAREGGGVGDSIQGSDTTSEPVRARALDACDVGGHRRRRSFGDPPGGAKKPLDVARLETCSRFRSRGTTVAAMDELQDRIVAAIMHVSRKSGSLVTVDPVATSAAILAACAHWQATERKLVIPELKDAPPWVAHELRVLKLGRALDFLMRKLGYWKGRGPVLAAAAKIAADLRYGRGRQSFVAALGEHGMGAYGAEVAALLQDVEMTGYGVMALHRGANGEYLEQVLAAAQSGRPWVQSAARAYAASLQEAETSVRARRSRRAPVA